MENLTENDFQRVADWLGVEVAVVKAVQTVETGGRGGFVAPGRPIILFEGHIFWRELKKRGLDPERYVVGNENIGLPHRKHLYQIMANELKIPHVAVALTYMSVQTVVLVGYLLLREYGYGYLLGSILVLGLLYFLFMKRFFYLHKSN